MLRTIQTSTPWLRGLLCICLLCVGIPLVSAKRPDRLIRTQRASNTNAFYFKLEITNYVFNNSLLDHTSNYYKSLQSEVNDLMSKIFNSPGCMTADYYGGTKDMSFKKGDLVTVEMTVFFNMDINNIVVKNLFKFYFNDIETTLKINTSDTDVSVVTPAPHFTTAPTTSPSLMDSTATPISSATTPTNTRQPSTPSSTIGGISHSQSASSTMEPLSFMTKPSSSSSESPSPSLSSSQGTAFPLPGPTRIDPNTNGSTSAAATNYTTSGSATHLYNDTAGTSKAAITIHPDPTEHPNDHSSVTSISKPTASHQKGTNSTGITPYMLVQPYWWDWVPGWGIALLVLASLILVLLIILIILLLLRWCCMDEIDGAPSSDVYPQPYHEPYLSHSPAKTPILSHRVDDAPEKPEKPKGNRTGMYVVNPEGINNK